jgi:hypothetical protein
MRVLIIASPRSGSTTLTRAISTALNLKEYMEPYNKFWGSKYFKKNADFFEKDCIVKSIAYEKSPGYKGSALEFLSEFANQFDKVVLLDRRDFQLQLESYSYMRQHRYDGDWQAKYIFNESTDLNVDNYYLSLLKDNISFLAKQLNKPITYYEDIYSNNIELVEKRLKQTGLELTYEQLLPYIGKGYKLRVNKKDMNLL